VHHSQPNAEHNGTEKTDRAQKNSLAFAQSQTEQPFLCTPPASLGHAIACPYDAEYPKRNPKSRDENFGFRANRKDSSHQPLFFQHKVSRA
jgi:hypothetical protein